MSEKTRGAYNIPSEDPTKRIQDLGVSLVTALAKSIRLTQIFERGNRALNEPVAQLLDIATRLFEFDSAWDLKIRKDHLHLCDLRLKIGVDIFLSYHYLVDEMLKREVGALGINAPPTAKMLLDFLYAFREAGQLPAGFKAFQHLEHRLRSLGLQAVHIEPLSEETAREPTEADSIRRRSMSTYFKAIYLTHGILGAVGSHRVVHVRRAKRLVASLVDIFNIDESMLMGLTNIKNFDEYTFNHSVNVCILSLAVGRRVGLSRHQLGELGLSSLYHDLGKTSIPHELLNKIEQLNRSDIAAFRRHPIEGVKQLIRLKGLSRTTVKLILSVFRHHNNYDRSGYPPLRDGENISLYSRIIRITDSYDAMTSKRIYRRGCMNNVEAIEELWALAGTHFDPTLVKIFISTVGIFPVGSFVQLNTGEIAVVLKNAFSDDDLLRPTVKTLAAWEDGPHHSRVVDLALDRRRFIHGYFQSSEAEKLLPSFLL